MKSKLIFNRFIEFLNLIRLLHWMDKMLLIIFATLIVLLMSNESQWRTFDLIIFFIYPFFLLSYGYLINSYSDRKIDSKVGKLFLSNFSLRFVKSLIIFLGIFSFLIPLLFKNIGIFVINIIIIFFATFYSLRTLRFKEYGFLGILVSAITQHSPFLFLFFIIENHSLLILYLFGWLIIIGIMRELAHQLDDYYNDKKTKTKTFAITVGKKKPILIIYWSTIVLILYLFFPIAYMFNGGILISTLLLIFSLETLSYTYSNIKKITS